MIQLVTPMVTLGMIDTTNDTHPVGADAAKRRAPQRVQSQHELPSDRFVFSKHFPVLLNAAARSGFGAKPIDSEAMGEGVSKQAGQLNAAFFCDIGLMEKKGRQYLPLEPTNKFAKLFTIDQDRARDVLRPVIATTWFAEAARNVLSIKQSVSEDALMRELAIACEVSNFAAKESSFRVLLGYLEWTGIIKRGEDGMYTLTATATTIERPLVAPAPEQPAPGASATSAHTVEPMPMTSPTQRAMPAQPAPTAAPEGWVHRSWPGVYQLAFKPDAKALKMLKRVVEDLEIALEDEAQTTDAAH